MRKMILRYALICSMLLTAIGCGKNDSPDDESDKDDTDYTVILADYVDKTVISTYAEMKDQSQILHEKVEELKVNPTQETLNACCLQWAKTRSPWEKSEAFLFGPAEYKSLDPLLDSWPLDQSQLEQVLAGKQALTAIYVKEGLGAVLRGFHTIEYLLFRDGSPRNLADVTAREFEYLTAVTEVLRDDSFTLWVLWHGDSALSEQEQTLLDDLELAPGKGFGYEFKSAGNSGSRYASQKDAIDQLIQGCIDITDEVGNSKIAGPYTSKNVLTVESQYSWNSLTDFKDNIRSIENSLYGGSDATKRGESLSALIKKKNPALETEIANNIQAAIAAINGVPEPFRNHLNSTSQITAALDALSTLGKSLEKLKALLV